MSKEIYKDPILQKYIDLIKATVGEGFFKEYYQGDPMRVPSSNMPCIILSRDESRMEVLTNTEDMHRMAISLTVITDMRNEISDDKTIAPGVAALYDIIEGREDDLTLKTKSILNILRTNVFVDAEKRLRTDLGSVTRADYGLTVGKRAPDAYAIEAQVEFIAHFTQIR